VEEDQEFLEARRQVDLTRGCHTSTKVRVLPVLIASRARSKKKPLKAANKETKELDDDDKALRAKQGEEQKKLKEMAVKAAGKGPMVTIGW